MGKGTQKQAESGEKRNLLVLFLALLSLVLAGIVLYLVNERTELKVEALPSPTSSAPALALPPPPEPQIAVSILPRPSPTVTSEALTSDTPIELVGVLLMFDPSLSLAALSDRKLGVTYALRIGETIPRRLTLLSMEPGFVTYTNLQNGKTETAVLRPKSQPLTPQSPIWKSVRYPGISWRRKNQIQMDPSLAQKFVSGLKNLWIESRCNPVTNDDGRMGFRCQSIIRGSYFDRLGIKNGDVITRDDHEPMDSPEEFLKVLTPLVNRGFTSFRINAGHGISYFSIDTFPQTKAEKNH